MRNKGNGVDTIYLTRGKESIIDKEDYDRVNKYMWHTGNHGYASHKNNSESLLLHRFIMSPKEGEYVDHINGNKLDNRKVNLRICSNSENAMHRVNLQSNNKSGYQGVHFDKSRGKWMSYIKVDNKRIGLGRFNAKEEAIKVRKDAETKYFGEFKPLDNLKKEE